MKRPFLLLPNDSNVSPGGWKRTLSTLVWLLCGLPWRADPLAVYSPRPSIRAELVNSGPVVATFTVFEDFMSYKAGVYRYVTGKRLGLQ